MVAWLILLVVLGPLLVFTGWVVIRQLRGGFDGPEPQATEPDFLQRHAWLGAWIILAIMSLRIGGLSGFFVGLLAGAVLFAFLAVVGSLLATLIERPEHQLPSPRDAFSRRFARNLRRAAKEGPRFWG